MKWPINQTTIMNFHLKVEAESDLVICITLGKMVEFALVPNLPSSHRIPALKPEGFVTLIASKQDGHICKVIGWINHEHRDMKLLGELLLKLIRAADSGNSNKVMAEISVGEEQMRILVGE
jgi:hypothetical protein